VPLEAGVLHNPVEQSGPVLRCAIELVGYKVIGIQEYIQVTVYGSYGVHFHR
jgi:hypothetical protein